MKEIPLTQGFVAFVDDADFEAVMSFKWYAQRVKRRVYAMRHRRKSESGPEYVYLHRFIMPQLERADFIDGNGLNCQRDNLCANINPGMKTCTGCHVEKPLTDFNRSAHGRNGMRARCIDCSSAENRVRYKKDLEASRKAGREYSKTRRELFPEKVKEAQLKSKYGLSLEQYNQMVLIQEGRCAICKEEYEPLCVDHNHINGEVRALLCDQCNIGISNFRDSAVRARAAADYLDRYPFLGIPLRDKNKPKNKKYKII